MTKNTSRLLLLCALFCIFTSSAINAQATPKDWTLAVYINADNNLDSFGLDDQDQMSSVGSSNFLNIVTLIDRFRIPTQIDYIEKNKIVTVSEPGEIDTGDYNSLIDFMRFIKDNYPAKKYALVIWNHGSGWKLKKLGGIFKGISYDDSSGNHITNEQLGIALAESKKILGQNIDVLIMDACLMQMVEVAYAIKDSCSYIVASEELEPGDGAPYDDILKQLKATTTPQALSEIWAREFAASYDGGSQGFDEATQSSIETAHFDPLVDAINGLAKAIMSGRYVRDVKAVLQRVQKFDERENIDLIHFATLLSERLASNSTIKEPAQKLIEKARKAVNANAIAGTTTKNANGIAIYLPGNFVPEEGYKDLSFSKKGLWYAMIAHLNNQAIVANVADEVTRGSLTSMKKLLKNLKQNSKNKAYVRFIVREINSVIVNPGIVPHSILHEFQHIYEEMKQLI